MFFFVINFEIVTGGGKKNQPKKQQKQEKERIRIFKNRFFLPEKLTQLIL